jgi:hypothetical protein
MTEHWRAYWSAKGNGLGVGGASSRGEGSSSSPKQRPALSSLVPKDEAPFDMIADAVDLEHEAQQLEQRTPNRFFEEPEDA